MRSAASEVNILKLVARNILVIIKTFAGVFDIPDSAYLFCKLTDLLTNRYSYRMHLLKSRHPTGKRERDLADGKFVQNKLENMRNILKIQINTAHKCHGRTVFFFKLVCKRHSPLGRRICGIENYRKWLSDRLQF